MAGLDDLNASIPDGKSALGLGDNAIRLVITKLLEYAAIEHALTGEHTFGVGTIAQRPAAGHKGRFYILTTAGVAVELQYDTGSGWATLTSNQAVLNYAEGLASHANASVLAHPDGSVTAAKIKAGAIHKGHLDGSGDGTSLASLVGGGVTDLHVHGAEVGANGMLEFNAPGNYTVTFPPGVFRMYFTVVGGGGAGGAGYLRGGGGGAAGNVIWNYPVTRAPGTILDMVVGVKGLGNNNYNTSGGKGGDSWVIGPMSVVAFGGQGGHGGSDATGDYGGQGGVAENGMIPSGSGGRSYAAVDGLPPVVDFAEPGGDTAWYNGGATEGQGGGGGGSFFGAGGVGAGPYTANQQAGTAGGPTAGGGGGGKNSEHATFGGNGGNGLIIVTW